MENGEKQASFDSITELPIEVFVRAYKRAKIDAWYAHALDADEVVAFERDFEKRINQVRTRIIEVANGGEFGIEELGGWRLETKSVKPKTKAGKGDVKDNSDEGILFSNPDLDPRQYEIDEISFRLIATPSILFHIISALWIDNVGYKFDAKLDVHSYGNRLRRSGKEKPNDNRAGSFVYYINQFKKWRETALRYVIKNLKDLGEDIVVVTADAHAFYHCLKPDFLTNEAYLKATSINLDDGLDFPLTNLIQKAIKTWANATPLQTGLPVGLPASAVIANAALCEFDSVINDQVQPLFYGRYVDDVLLVLKWIKKWRNIGDIWHWIQTKTNGCIALYEGDEGKIAGADYDPSHPPYGLIFKPKAYNDSLTDTMIAFQGSKCKAFFLDSETGLPIVEALKKRIRELSSEFRLLPEHVGDEERIRTKIHHLIPEDGNNPDNFRKINSQEFRRSDFMELLKEFEGYERVLPPSLWRNQRLEFYKAFYSILMAWPFFVDFEKYIPRVVGLMTRNADFECLKKFLDKIATLLEKLKVVQEKMYISGPSKTFAKEYVALHWGNSLMGIIKTGVLGNIKGKSCVDKSYARLYDQFAKSYIVRKLLGVLPSYEEGGEKIARAYLIHDVSHERLAMFSQREETHYISKICKLGAFFSHDCMLIDIGARFFTTDFLYCANLVSKAINGHDIFSDGVPFGVLFPTRPISLRNVSYFRHGVLGVGDATKIIKAFRGYIIGRKIAATLDSLLASQETGIIALEPCKMISVADKPRKDVNVALMSIRTSDEHIHLEMKRKPAKALLERYKAVVKLINDVLRNETRPQYVLFHELCLPPLWFAQIAEKCFGNGVSIVSGIDYIKGKKPLTCTNEVWMSLVALEKNFPEFVFISEKKDKLAYGEESELMSKYGYKMDDLEPDEKFHNIISHGNFSFSTLICSELLDMPKRCRLIGKIDALFVVSWNQDIETFDEIIRSTASDIHAYVVFCNNNEYGDSRVRVPRKERWARDVVEVRGGEEPYFVVGKLDIYELRKFQSHFNPALLQDGKFKPLPMGYMIDESRKVDV